MRVKLLILLTYCVLGGALINNELFGLQTLAAYFFYIIGVSTAALFLFLKVAAATGRISVSLPLHTVAFILFCIYVNVHGIITNYYDIVHLYWLSNALFFVYILIVKENWQPATKPLAVTISNGVFIIAAVESLIVLLQAAAVFKTKNNLFIASGSWTNPNVTAIFLAVSIHFVLASEMFSKKRAVGLMVLVTILLSLVILQSRTAFIVATLAVFFNFRPRIINRLNKVFPAKGRLIFPVLLIACMALCVLILAKSKHESTSGRLLVYKNSTAVIKEHLFTGSGFGQFERSYNHFVGENILPSNGHVNMAYNDFIELTVEGGLIALLLWLFFLACAGIYAWRKKQPWFPLSAILVIQLTNFGFQAVPVIAILLLSLALPFSPDSTSSNVKKRVIKVPGTAGVPISKSFGLAAALALLLLTVYGIRKANAFHELHKIPIKEYARSLYSFKKLEARLAGQPFFHEKFGDAYMSMRNPHMALQQYQLALRNCSYPVVMVKCGYAFQQRNMFDSSIRYYNLAQNIEPFKFATQMVILKMYEHKKDTLNTVRIASKILNMPVKVESEKVDQIRKYADNVLLKINKRYE